MKGILSSLFDFWPRQHYSFKEITPDLKTDNIKNNPKYLEIFKQINDDSANPPHFSSLFKERVSIPLLPRIEENPSKDLTASISNDPPFPDPPFIPATFSFDSKNSPIFPFNSTLSSLIPPLTQIDQPFSPLELTPIDLTSAISNSHAVHSLLPNPLSISSGVSVQNSSLDALSSTEITNQLKSACTILALPLLVLYLLYKSKIKVLQTIDINIQATNNKKLYEIGAGIEDKVHMTFASLEVQKGQPLRHHGYQNKLNITAKNTAKTALQLFVSKTFLSKIPVISMFEKDRIEPHTSFNIIINDSGNPLLQKGPVVEFFQLSDHEGFKIVHQDPTVKIIDKEVYSIKAEKGSFDYFYTQPIHVSDPISLAKEHRTQKITLPFKEPNDKDEYYTSVTQQRLL